MTEPLRIAAAVTFILLIVSCTPEDAPALPEGPQTMTGVLLQLPLSLSYRGSHRFQREPGVDYAYAESTAVNLRKHEGKTVVLRGTLQRNLRPEDPPVLTVLAVDAILEEPVRAYNAPSLGIAFEAPESWRVEVSSGSVRVILPALTQPLISMTKENLLQEPRGEPIVLDRQRALFIMSETDGSERILLPRGSTALQLHFQPQNDPRADQLRKQWSVLLESVSLTMSGGSSGSSITSGAPGTGTGGIGTPVPTDLGPCGGPAGILCPAGSYCEIENLQENIGHCRPLGQ